MKRDYKFSELIKVQELRDYAFDLEDIQDLTDKQVKIILDHAGYLIQRYIDYPVLQEPIEELIEGSNTDILYVSSPIYQLLSVREVDEVLNKTVIPLSDILYRKKSDHIYRRDGEYFYNIYTYEVKYYSGELVLPDVVKEATFITATHLVRIADYRGIKSIKIDVISIQFDDTKKEYLPEEAKFLLYDYKDNLNFY